MRAISAGKVRFFGEQEFVPNQWAGGVAPMILDIFYLMSWRRKQGDPVQAREGAWIDHRAALDCARRTLAASIPNGGVAGRGVHVKLHRNGSDGRTLPQLLRRVS